MGFSNGLLLLCLLFTYDAAATYIKRPVPHFPRGPAGSAHTNIASSSICNSTSSLRPSSHGRSSLRTSSIRRSGPTTTGYTIVPTASGGGSRGLIPPGHATTSRPGYNATTTGAACNATGNICSQAYQSVASNDGAIREYASSLFGALAASKASADAAASASKVEAASVAAEVSASKGAAASLASAVSASNILKSMATAVDRCRSGDLNNPKPDDWKKYDVDNWWIGFRKKYKGDGNTVSPITDLITTQFNRPALSITCNEKSTSCGVGVGDCVQWLNSAPDKSASGQLDAARAYIWFTGYSYLGNIVSAIAENTRSAGAQVGLEIQAILTKFTNPPKPPQGPDRIASGLGPALGAIGGIFGLLGKGAPGAAFSGFGNLISALGNSFYVANQKAGDFRIDVLGGLSDQYATVAYIIGQGLTEAFNTIILYDNGTANHYASLSEILKDGLFLDFKIAYAWNSGEISKAVFNGVMKFFQFQAVNTIWRLQNVFIVYTPYNSKVLDATPYNWDGKKWRDNFQKKDCEEIVFYKGRQNYPSADCTDEAMIFLVGDPAAAMTEEDVVPGGNLKPVTLVGGTQLTFRDIVASSVEGWKTLGWSANVSNPAYDAIVSNTGQAWKDIKVADVTRFNEIGPRVPGIFNVPICKTYDIRFFVGLQDANDGNPGPGLPDYAEFCLTDAANSPAQQKEPFRNHIDPGLVKYMKDHHVWGGDTWVGDKWEKVPL